MSVRRYKVLEAPNTYDRERLTTDLQSHAFRPAPASARAGETVGWVSLHNLCVTEFLVQDCWYDPYFCWSLRIDTKRLPAKLIKAMLDLRFSDWLAETGRESVPSQVKSEMREQLELEMFPRQLPSVVAHDICWDTHKGVLHLFSTSNRVEEIFRTLFHKTFGLVTRRLGPVALVASTGSSERWVPALDSIGHSDYRPGARA